MRQTLERRENPAQYFSDSAHLRQEGHALLAAAILEELRQDKIVP